MLRLAATATLAADSSQLQPAARRWRPKEGTKLTVTNCTPLPVPLRRHRRRAAPGAMQLEEARRREPPANKRKVIHAMLKGQALLACDLQSSHPDDTVSLVLWYKDKSMVPIYR